MWWVNGHSFHKLRLFIDFYTSITLLVVSSTLLLTGTMSHEFSFIFQLRNPSSKNWGKPRVLHKKWSFPLRISSVNVTKSAVLWIWSHSLEKFLMENFIFCAVWVRIFCENMYHKDLKFRTLAIWNKPFVPLRNNLYPTLSHHFVFPKSTKRTSFTEEKQTLEVFCKKMCS